MQAAIEDHGIVGDLHTLALVALDGAIDYLCWPRFDSPSVFANLLDENDGGVFSIAPALSNARHRQLYLPDTNVLLTRSLSDEGVAEISDFMAIGNLDGKQRLVRRVKAVRGTIEFNLVCAPRFDYSRSAHSIESDGESVIFSATGDVDTRLRLTSDIELALDGQDVRASFVLTHGQTASFVLEDADTGRETPDLACVSEDFKTTSDWWRDWSMRSSYRGRWHEAVSRSALTLKLLTSAEHGSILAAGTFGLPEEIGGVRNWDYRYTWMRDAAFTVYAFVRVGHVDEARAFMVWLSRLTEHETSDGRLGILYRLDGNDDLVESELTHFSGHRDSRPVRIGNGAADQLQLDIYGELLDAIHLADQHGEQVTHAGWAAIGRMLEYLDQHWQDPDEGIWEVRSGRSEFLYSRLMCWVAFDRGLRLAEKRSLPAPIVRWRDTRNAIHHDIHQQFWNRELGAFIQRKGSDMLDASCLLMPLVGFISPTDPRWLSTLDAIGDHLTDDSLVFRYSTEAEPGSDGLDGGEGTFNMCSFWYIECLARAGRIDEARFLFDKMLGYANHLGLFAEETGAAGEQLGNFPQAFTHLALIRAALCLDEKLQA